MKWRLYQKGMSKVYYSRDKVDKEIISQINNIIKKFDIINKTIKDSDIPLDLNYRDFILNLIESFEEYKTVLNGIIEKIEMFDYEISNIEYEMFQKINKIDDINYNYSNL